MGNFLSALFSSAPTPTTYDPYPYTYPQLDEQRKRMQLLQAITNKSDELTNRKIKLSYATRRLADIKWSPEQEMQREGTIKQVQDNRNIMMEKPNISALGNLNSAQLQNVFGDIKSKISMVDQALYNTERFIQYKMAMGGFMSGSFWIGLIVAIVIVAVVLIAADYYLQKRASFCPRCFQLGSYDPALYGDSIVSRP